MLKHNTHSDILDDEVIEDKSVTGGTDTKTDAEATEVDGEAELLRPRGVDISESDDLWHNLSVRGRLPRAI